MGKYILKRAVLAVMIIFAISLLTFIVLNVIPGDVVAAMLGEFASKDAIETARHQTRSRCAFATPIFALVTGLGYRKSRYELLPT